MVATCLLFGNTCPCRCCCCGLGGAFVILLLLRSLQMSNALVARRIRPAAAGLLAVDRRGAAHRGMWSVVYIYAAQRVPVTMQYMFCW